MEYAESLSPHKLYAEPIGGHVSLGKALRGLIWFIPMIIVAAILFVAFGKHPPLAPLAVGIGVAIGITWGIIVSGIRIAAQWEKGVILRLGEYHRTAGPGIIYIVPFIDYVRFVDLRILALNIPSQKVITKDNVPASIDGVLFFLVSNAENAVLGGNILHEYHNEHIFRMLIDAGADVNAKNRAGQTPLFVATSAAAV
jgi:regulator of protease activity HflC (stomatin/prohibitin superfamily)